MNLGMRRTRRFVLMELVGWGSWMWVHRSWASYTIGLRAYLTFGEQKKIARLAVTEPVLTVLGWLLQKPWIIVPLSYRFGHGVCILHLLPSYGICPLI